MSLPAKRPVRRRGGEVLLDSLCIHFLPHAWARKLLPWFSLRAVIRHGDNRDLKELAGELRLLGYREFRSLFPDAEIHRERWFGLTKSFTAIRRDCRC